MAKTLKEFLENKAAKDLATLQCAYRLLPTSKVATEALKTAIDLVGYEDTPVAFIMPVRKILAAANVSLCQAGEAIKNIERNEPETYKDLPDFPWDSVKRLRDILTHVGAWVNRTGPTAEDLEMRKRMEKELKKIDDATKKEGPTFASDKPRTDSQRLVMEGIVWFQRLSQIAAGRDQSETIPIGNTPFVEDILREDLGKAAKALPAIIIIQSLRFEINATMDLFNRTSNFCKASYPTLFDSPELTRFRQIRANLAHFKDRFEDISNFANSADIDNCIKAMDKLRTKFPHIERMETDNDIEQHVSAIAQDYERLILGKTPISHEKQVEIDRFVSWITRNFQGKDRLQEAAIFAAGHAMGFQLGEAKEILNYIYEHKKDLNNPTLLQQNLSGKSKVLQIGVRDFAESMGEQLALTDNGRNTREIN